MSDQNLNADNSFVLGDSSGPRPLPIASQIVSQSYLSHVQKNSDVDAEDDMASHPELAKRFGPAGTQNQEEQQRENRMDAFFREAEAERAELLAASQNGVIDPYQPSAPDQNQPDTPNPVAGEQEAVDLPQTDSKSDFPQPPVIETAPSSDGGFASEQPPVAGAGQYDAAPITTGFNVAPRETGPDVVSQFTVDQGDFHATEPVDNFAENDQPEATSTSPFASSSFGNGLPFGQSSNGGTNESQPAVSEEPMVVSQPAPEGQSGPATEPMTTADAPAMYQAVDTGFQTQQTTTETTNEETPEPSSPASPGWTAAIASVTAGVVGAAGIVGANLNSGSQDDASGQASPLENAGPDVADVADQSDAANFVTNQDDDAVLISEQADGVYQQIQQQMEDEASAQRARFTLPTYQLTQDSDMSLIENIVDPNDSNDSDSKDDNENFEDPAEANTEDVSGQGDAGQDDNVEDADNADNADQGGNEANADQDNLVQHDSVAPQDSLENISEKMAFAAVPPVIATTADVQPSTDVQPFTDMQPSTDKVDDEHQRAKDDRLAAEQKAQKIKADRVKALADLEPEPARPYGSRPAGPQAESNGQENQGSVDSNSQGPLPTMEPSRIDAALSQAAAPSGSQPPRSQRPFPLNLFHQHLFENLRSGVVYVDHQKRVRFWSKGAEAMTGISAEAVMERPLYPQTYNLRLEDGTGVTLGNCPITKCLEQMEHLSFDYRILNAANQEVKIELSVTPVVDEDRYVNGVVLVFDDHSAEIDLQRQLKDLYEFSVLDPLTQVANRAEFERVLEEYVRAFNASEDFNCSLIICDIDYFKSINDNFGHAVGDQALVAFAEMLRTYVRSQDLVARYGGEEFVILCADCDTNSALHRAEQIRMALFKTQQPMLDGKAISASFGVSELRGGDTAIEFFVRADTALLKAKEMGRNRVVIADQREAIRSVSSGEESPASGMQWRQQRREHTALICMEFITATPVPVLVEKLRGFIIDKDASLHRVDQEFLSMEVDFESPEDYSRKGSFTMNIEFKDGDEKLDSENRRATFVRVSIFPGRKKKWFSTNHTDVAPFLLADLRSYLMINDDASKLSVDMATEDVRGKEA